MKRRTIVFGGSLVALLGALALGQSVLSRAAEETQTVEAPMFVVVPLWP
jgi:hypothetical protein